MNFFQLDFDQQDQSNQQPNQSLDENLTPNSISQVFLYRDFSATDNLRPILNYNKLHACTNHPFTSWMKQQWNQHTRVLNDKLQSQFGLKCNYDNSYTKLHFSNIHFLSRMQEAEVIDLVLNQYGLFVHENNVHDVIKPISQFIPDQSQFDKNVSYFKTVLSEQNWIRNFHHNTNQYFQGRNLLNCVQTLQLMHLMHNSQNKNQWPQHLSRILCSNGDKRLLGVKRNYKLRGNW